MANNKKFKRKRETRQLTKKELESGDWMTINEFMDWMTKFFKNTSKGKPFTSSYIHYLVDRGYIAFCYTTLVNGYSFSGRELESAYYYSKRFVKITDEFRGWQTVGRKVKDPSERETGPKVLIG